MSSQRRRSAGRPCASRGYHASGTETLRPSLSSTVSDWSVIRTPLAVAAARPEEVMPRLQQFGLVTPHQGLDLVQLILRESAVVCHHDGVQPELGYSFVTVYMDMGRFRAVAREEEHPIGTVPKNCWAHTPNLAIVDSGPSSVCDPANVPLQPRRLMIAPAAVGCKGCWTKSACGG